MKELWIYKGEIMKKNINTSKLTDLFAPNAQIIVDGETKIIVGVIFDNNGIVKITTTDRCKEEK